MTKRGRSKVKGKIQRSRGRILTLIVAGLLGLPSVLWVLFQHILPPLTEAYLNSRESLRVRVVPAKGDYSVRFSKRSFPNKGHSIQTYWDVEAINTADRPVTILSYEISDASGATTNYRWYHSNFADIAEMPLVIAPGHVAKFKIRKTTSADERVVEALAGLPNFRANFSLDLLRDELLKRRMDVFGNVIDVVEDSGKIRSWSISPAKIAKEDRFLLSLISAAGNRFSANGDWYGLRGPDRKMTRDELSQTFHVQR